MGSESREMKTKIEKSYSLTTEELVKKLGLKGKVISTYAYMPRHGKQTVTIVMDE